LETDRFLFPSTLQKDADPSKQNTVVLILQDMLEVFTNDMMVNENRLVNLASSTWI
jgi:callose synthase